MHDPFLAIEIGGTKLQIVAGRGDGTILERHRFAVDRTRGADSIRDHIASALPELTRRWQPLGVGVGFGGPVDWKTGRIWQSYQVSGWSGFELAKWIGQTAGVPSVVDNDANVAALGEARCGAGCGHRISFYITLGSGVGGGLAVDGSIYHAEPPGEMEFGHLRLDASGVTVQDRCAGWALDERVRTIAATNPTLASLLDGADEPPTKTLGRALAQGDQTAADLLDEYATDLAFGLSHAVHLLHPDVIVIGGGVSLLGEPLRAALTHKLSGFLMSAFQPGPTIALATLREDAVPIGALLLAQQRLSPEHEILAY